MWNTQSKNSTDLTMCEGDFGVSLPFVIKGITIGGSDVVRLTVKKTKNGSPLIEKEYTSISQNTINISFTEDESMLLKVGNYVYSLDWYQGDTFMYNIVNNAKLKVEDKI